MASTAASNKVVLAAVLAVVGWCSESVSESESDSADSQLQPLVVFLSAAGGSAASATLAEPLDDLLQAQMADPGYAW